MPGTLEVLSRRIGRAAELARLVVTSQRVRQARAPLRSVKPVLFFNASTRLSGLSQNAGFSLLTSWIFQQAGIPVIHFVCKAGMSRCVLGTDETDLSRPMPCGMCIRQSRANYCGSAARWFKYQEDKPLAAVLETLNLQDLIGYEQPLPKEWPLAPGNMPLGSLVLPSLRWRLRLLNPADEPAIRSLVRQFLLSAWNIACQFMEVLTEVQPESAVIFNGIQFPEATAAWLGNRYGMQVITHEAGFQPISGYFSKERFSLYPIVIPDVDLTSGQNDTLDANLQKRWQGDFSMAGVKFWSEMQDLPEGMMRKSAGYKQVVSIFTNVIFDTSQMTSNIVFPDMFTWLDELVEVFHAHPETLFVLRAHPDEARPGKASRESVTMWFEKKAGGISNMVFIPPHEGVNSYKLIQLSKFILIYNSNIGLEAMLLGVPVLAAGQAPFTAFETVFFDPDRSSYFDRLKLWLTASHLDDTPERCRNVRRFLYHRTFRFSIPFNDFLESTQPMGYVRLKKFPLSRLAQSATAQAILGGLLKGKRFELDA